MTPLHIVEPKLIDLTGHSHSLTQAFIAAAPPEYLERLHIWMGKNNEDLLKDCGVKRHLYFGTRLYRLEKFLCYRQLLKRGHPIFVPTTGTLDFLFLHGLLRGKRPRGKIFLYVHQFYTDKLSAPRKINMLKKLARLYPDWIVLTTTPGLLKVFQDMGFSQCEYAPCFGYSHRQPLEGPFQKLVYAGAARTDKGFGQCVAFLQELDRVAPHIPWEIQGSLPTSRRYEEDIKRALPDLHALALQDPSRRKVYRETLSQVQYQDLFQAAIVLQVYEKGSYLNKFSGITLDACYAGSPVIGIQGTWTGSVIEEFGAGIALATPSVPAMVEAFQTIYDNYASFQKGARQAGQTLSKVHDPGHIWNIIMKYLSQV